MRCPNVPRSESCPLRRIGSAVRQNGGVGERFRVAPVNASGQRQPFAAFLQDALRQILVRGEALRQNKQAFVQRGQFRRRNAGFDDSA